ncbi:hypothetical protein [Paenibacillus oleatilyticus]|uniref:hypothetical protein n=1 Tax=Paenibacillus oleatilyticus TaxID=2594886 RepID=UPI001C1FC4F5|nr:hypothetical protein [Paenibacillus oleatilyticus]MBU7319006.1 hypothetical protein [Paenibacillus oleatilyticus]
MSMYFNDKQLAELRKEFRTHPVDEEGRVKPVDYSEEYVRGTVLKLLSDIEGLHAEIERLTKEYAEERAAHNAHVAELLESEKLIKQFTKERDDHGPEGRNYTNGQYVELLMKYEAMREALDLTLPIVEHNSPTRAEMIRSILAKIGEGEKP